MEQGKASTVEGLEIVAAAVSPSSPHSVRGHVRLCGVGHGTCRAGQGVVLMFPLWGAVIGGKFGGEAYHLLAGPGYFAVELDFVEGRSRQELY
jgi:hypothetical protein